MHPALLRHTRRHPWRRVADAHRLLMQSVLHGGLMHQHVQPALPHQLHQLAAVARPAAGPPPDESYL
jgi:hypothetical protein